MPKTCISKSTVVLPPPHQSHSSNIPHRCEANGEKLGAEALKDSRCAYFFLLTYTVSKECWSLKSATIAWVSLDNLVVAKMLQCHLEQSTKCAIACSMFTYRSLLCQILASENVSWFFSRVERALLKRSAYFLDNLGTSSLISPGAWSPHLRQSQHLCQNNASESIQYVVGPLVVNDKW